MEKQSYLTRFNTYGGHELSVWGDKDAAILTFGPPGCSANIHLNADDCERLRVLLAEVVAQMEKAPSQAQCDFD